MYVFKTREHPVLDGSKPRQQIGQEPRLVKRMNGEKKMVRSSNTNGFNAVATVINSLLVVAVFAGAAAALTQIVA